MKRFVRSALLCGVLAAAVSCSFESPEIQTPTRLDIQVDKNSIKGTQAVITISPEDDRVYYMAGVVSNAEYDTFIKHFGSEKGAADSSLKEMYNEYADDWKLLYGDHAYISSFRNSKLIYGDVVSHVTGLTPETDYYAFAYCVNCVNDSTFTMNGELYKVKFRTTEIQYDLSKMQLEFMLRDYDGKLYCYTKPTYFDYDLQHNGKICRDPYLVDMVSQADLDEIYGGDLFAFAYTYYSNLYENDLLSENLHTDITRNEYNMSLAGEGECFYIVGAPLNVTNLNILYVLKFQYKRGMNVKYSSETVKAEAS